MQNTSACPTEHVGTTNVNMANVVKHIALPALVGNVEPTDLIIMSNDWTCFHVHRSFLLLSSSNGFNNLLSSGYSADEAIVYTPETTLVLAIILYTVYGVDCRQFSPSLEDLLVAAMTMPTYGMCLEVVLAPTTSLYCAILTHASSSAQNALVVYSFASRHDLFLLASVVSSNLLSIHPLALTDESTCSMDPVYLKRLVLLHVDRTKALKKLLETPQAEHGPVPGCSAGEQKQRIKSTWSKIAAYLVFNASADLSTETIRGLFYAVHRGIPCALCKRSLEVRLQALTNDWANVKASVSLLPCLKDTTDRILNAI